MVILYQTTKLKSANIFLFTLVKTNPPNFLTIPYAMILRAASFYISLPPPPSFLQIQDNPPTSWKKPQVCLSPKDVPQPIENPKYKKL